MTEDVSATTRLAVTICLIAALMTVTINLLIISNSVLRNFAVSYTIAAANQQPAAIWDVNQMRHVNGALLYRILSENETRIDLTKFQIRDLKADGSTGGYLNTIADFKKKAGKEYSVKIELLDSGMLKITGNEVKV